MRVMVKWDRFLKVVVRWDGFLEVVVRWDGLLMVGSLVVLPVKGIP